MPDGLRLNLLVSTFYRANSQRQLRRLAANAGLELYKLDVGLPVTSTPMSEVNLCEHLIEIVNSPAEFEAAVEKCLATAESDSAARLTAMAGETWPQKVKHICEVLP